MMSIRNDYQYCNSFIKGLRDTYLTFRVRVGHEGGGKTYKNKFIVNDCRDSRVILIRVRGTGE